MNIKIFRNENRNVPKDKKFNKLKSEKDAKEIEVHFDFLGIALLIIVCAIFLSSSFTD